MKHDKIGEYYFTAGDLFTGSYIIQMPTGSKIISVGVQTDVLVPQLGVLDHVLVFWAQVASTAEQIDRLFFIVGTGSLLPNQEDMRYAEFVGTVTYKQNTWHIYSTEIEYAINDEKNN